MDTKRCNKCGRNLPATTEYFHRTKSIKNGLRNPCRECRKGEGKSRTFDYTPQPDVLYPCSLCGTSYPKTRDYFYSDRTNPGGLSYCCIQCTKKRARQWEINNPERKREQDRRRYWSNHERTLERLRDYRLRTLEKTRERGRRWAKNHREHGTLAMRKARKQNPEKYRAIKHNYRAKARGLNNNFSAEHFKFALDYFNGCCPACGRPLRDLFSTHKPAADHWIPLSSPDCPGTTPTNIVPLCHGIDGCNNSKSNRNPSEWLVWKFGKRKAREIEARINTYFEAVKHQFDLEE